MRVHRSASVRWRVLLGQAGPLLPVRPAVHPAGDEMTKKRTKTCRQPDVNVPALPCGHRLPCPYHPPFEERKKAARPRQLVFAFARTPQKPNRA